MAFKFENTNIGVVRFRIGKKLTQQEAENYAREQLKDEIYKNCTIDKVFVNEMLVGEDIKIT